MKRIAAGLLLLLALAPASLAAQYFGQNRMQYTAFKFKIIETQHFEVFYYDQARAVALDAARMAERSYIRLSNVLGHDFREKKPIILYASHSDFQQTNALGEQPSEATGGVTDFYRHRMVLPLTGSYEELEHVMQHEMTHQFQYDIWSNGTPGAGLQFLIQLNPPLWFVEGMAEYLSIGPVDPNTAMWLRDAALEGTLPTINQLEHDPRVFPYRFGHAILAYIGERWGDESIGTIMRSTMAGGGGLDGAFRRSIGISLDQLSDEWRDYVNKKYLPEIANRQKARSFSTQLLTEKTAEGDYHLAPGMSPDGSQLVYFSERNWISFDLYLADAATGKVRKRLLKSTYSGAFETFRFINSSATWSPDGTKIVLAAKQGPRDRILIVDVEAQQGRQGDQAAARCHHFPVLQPGWEPHRLHRLRRRHFRPLHRQHRRLGPAAPDRRQVRRSGAGLVAGREDDRLHHRPGSGHRFQHPPVRQHAGGAVPPGRRHDRGAAPDGDGQEREPAVGARRSVDRLRLRPQRRQQSLSLQVQRSADLPADQSLHRHPGHHVDGAGDLLGCDRRPAGLRVLRGRRFRHLRREQSARPGQRALAAAALPDRPRRDPGGARAGAGARADSTDPELALAPDTTRAQVRPDTAQAEPAVTSLYRTPEGFRAADAPTTSADSLVPPPVSISALMDTATPGLPDTLDFLFRPYKVHYSVDYLARPTIGYTRQSFGGGFYGGSTVVLGDMLGDHNLVFSGYINGQIGESMVLAEYVNRVHRLNWATSIGQTPYYNLLPSQIVYDYPFVGAQTYIENVRRLIFRDAQIQAIYPLSRFQRIEGSMRLANVDDAIQQTSYAYDPVTGASIGNPTRRIIGLENVFFIAPTAALVYDNTIDGWVGPAYGTRYRIGVTPTVGGWNFTTLNVDYRRYILLPRPFTLAFRAQYFGQIGQDASLFQVFIGNTALVRGNTPGSYQRDECSYARNYQDGLCVPLQDLIGTQMGTHQRRAPVPDPDALDAFRARWISADRGSVLLGHGRRDQRPERREVAAGTGRQSASGPGPDPELRRLGPDERVRVHDPPAGLRHPAGADRHERPLDAEHRPDLVAPPGPRSGPWFPSAATLSLRRAEPPHPGRRRAVPDCAVLPPVARSGRLRALRRHPTAAFEPPPAAQPRRPGRRVSGALAAAVGVEDPGKAAGDPPGHRRRPRPAGGLLAGQQGQRGPARPAERAVPALPLPGPGRDDGPRRHPVSRWTTATSSPRPCAGPRSGSTPASRRVRRALFGTKDDLLLAILAGKTSALAVIGTDSHDSATALPAGPVTSTFWGDLLAVAADSAVVLIDPRGGAPARSEQGLRTSPAGRLLSFGTPAVHCRRRGPDPRDEPLLR